MLSISEETFVDSLMEIFQGQNFPKTKFGTSILMVTKKEGHDYAGTMLLSLLLAILSDRGREIMLVEKEIHTTRIEDQVHIIELILGMEEWLKAGSHTYEEVKHLPNAIDDFITKINHCCQHGDEVDKESLILPHSKI